MCDTLADRDTTAAVPLQEHRNDNLLKIDTHDKYSTVNAIKKHLLKELPGLKTADGQAPQPFFKGLLRMNKNPKNVHLFMAFETEADKNAALEQLLKVKYRSQQWVEARVDAQDLALTHKGGRKRPREEEGGEGVSKLTQYEQFTLPEQYEKKKAHCLGVMKAILPPREYGHDTYATRFRGLVESPVTEGYRNNVTLSFGLDDEGRPALGYLKGAIVDGKTTIESAVDEDRNVLSMHPVAKEVGKRVMEVYKEFEAAEKGGLQVFDKIKLSGFWRRVQIRHSTVGEVLVDVELDAESVAEGVLQGVCAALTRELGGDSLRARLQELSGSDAARVASLQYHSHSGISSLPLTAPRTVLLGEATLQEHLAGLKFELSPTAFFQVNTPGMERMLEKVREAAALSERTTLLDLCSGTGTIGLTLARHVRRVIGIEMVADAVENARRNAVLNGVNNAVFHCARVEDKLPDVINALCPDDREDIVAILDPPRAGVHATVLRWIRGTPTIRRVVYISCEQKALERDCPALTKPPTKAYRGAPFEVSSGFAVDLFPHTHHVEMVAVLDRLDTPDEPVAEEGETAPHSSN